MSEATLTRSVPQVSTVKLSAIVFDEAVYPRKAHDPALVQRYADCLPEIEAAGKYLCIAQDNTLLDGKHRWLAYRTVHAANGDVEVPVYVYDAAELHAKFALAVELNSSHGYQLTTEDKEQAAKTLYREGRGYSQEDIARMLSVGLTRVNAWLARTIKETKEKQNRRIWELWLACWTEEEIAETVGLPRKTVDDRLADLAKDYRGKIPPKHSFSDDDFKPPLYNVWKQQEKTNRVEHFGNSEARWVENLLYLYTEPLDTVVDLFGGGGSTIDVCQRRGRRYWVSDRKPIVSRETEIRQHDITTGLPRLRWSDVRLVYLDPPYWKQAEGQYSQDPTDLANMSLEEFNRTLAGLIASVGKKLSAGAHIALIIQPTQWKAPDRHYTDHVADMLRLVKLPVAMRISCPYESQQCSAQMVEWAKEHRTPLVLTREIVIWEVPA